MAVEMCGAKYWRMTLAPVNYTTLHKTLNPLLIKINKKFPCFPPEELPRGDTGKGASHPGQIWLCIQLRRIQEAPRRSKSRGIQQVIDRVTIWLISHDTAISINAL